MPVISASRRTDIPAFYSRWFMNRIRAGFCHYLNPFSSQAYQVSLAPKDCTAIVFWTRNPKPLLPYRPELDERGYKYYFLYTLLDYPQSIESHTPALETAIETFQTLSERVSPYRVFWRYDPIVISNRTPPEFHLERFAYIAQQLAGYTQRCIYSFMVAYGKVTRNLNKLSQHEGLEFNNPSAQQRHSMLNQMVDITQENGMQLYACCENDDLNIVGIKRSKCVDLDVLQEINADFSLHLNPKPTRPLCGCVESIDIGGYDTCLFGCTYCYATNSRQAALQRYQSHDPNDTVLYRPPKLKGIDLDLITQNGVQAQEKDGVQPLLPF